MSEYALPTEAPEKSVDVGKALAVGPSGTIALESTDSRHVSVRDHFYRTSGTGTWGQGANISAAISSAQLDAKAQRKTVFIGRGLHLISQSIEFDYADALSDGHQTNAGLCGANVSSDVVGNDPSEGTILRWNGAPGSTMCKIKSRGVTIDGICFSVGGGIPIAAAISIDKGAANAGTRCRVTRCQIRGGAVLHGGAGGLMTDGIVLGPTAGVNNLEYNVFEDLMIIGVLGGGIKIASDTGQSKVNVIRNCNVSYSKYGIDHISGSFVTEGYFGSRDLETVFNLLNITEPCFLRGLDSEFCDRIINRGNTSDNWPLVLEGARIAWPAENLVASDGDPGTAHQAYILLGSSGILHMRNCLVESADDGATDPALFKIVHKGFAADASPGVAQIIAEGCRFPGPNPFKTHFSTAANGVLQATIIACKYRTYSAGPPFVESGYGDLPSGTFRLVGPSVTALPSYDYETHPNHGTFMPNTSAAPADTVAGGGRRYVAAGAFVYRGSSNTVTTLAPA